MLLKAILTAGAYDIAGGTSQRDLAPIQPAPSAYQVGIHGAAKWQTKANEVADTSGSNPPACYVGWGCTCARNPGTFIAHGPGEGYTTRRPAERPVNSQACGLELTPAACRTALPTLTSAYCSTLDEKGNSLYAGLRACGPVGIPAPSGRYARPRRRQPRPRCGLCPLPRQLSRAAAAGCRHGAHRRSVFSPLPPARGNADAPGLERTVICRVTCLPYPLPDWHSY